MNKKPELEETETIENQSSEQIPCVFCGLDILIQSVLDSPGDFVCPRCGGVYEEIKDTK